MDRRNWILSALLALPLAVAGGLVYANTNPEPARGYTCPLTGEQLPCEKCCPLNKEQQAQQPYTCPATGEELPCEKCCPLNRGE